MVLPVPPATTLLLAVARDPVAFPLARAAAAVLPRDDTARPLRLETEPYTQVFVNGRKLGDTPLVDVELPAGVQVLHLVNADEHIDQRIEVEIKAGQLTPKKIKLQ